MNVDVSFNLDEDNSHLSPVFVTKDQWPDIQKPATMNHTQQYLPTFFLSMKL